MGERSLMYTLTPSSALTLQSDKSCTPIYAAIDLGTTSCRLLVARYSSRGIHIIERCSRPVLLGEGLRHTGRLAESAITRTLDALKHYAHRLSRHSLSGLQVVTTEACRYATNAQDFIQRTKRETGLDIRIITSREEAELAVESCSSLLGLSPQLTHPTSPTALASAARFLPSRTLLFDIGGGSTELSWIRLDHQADRHHLTGTTSLKLGIMSLFEHFSHLPKQCAYDAMFDYAYQKLKTFEAVHCIRKDIERQNVRMVGTSGIVTTLASIALELDRYRRSSIDGLCLGRQTLMHALHKLKKMSHSDMGRHPCIGRHRATLILSGCAIFDAIQSLWPVERIMIADRGLRDGMIVRMAREHRRSIGRARPAQRSHRASSHLPVGALAIPL